MSGIGHIAARRIIDVALAAGRAAGWRPLAVAVVDAGGHPVAFDRDDGAAPEGFETARARACAALAGAEPAGGVPVRDGAGRVVGAVGVSGESAAREAEAALAGIRAAGFAPEA